MKAITLTQPWATFVAHGIKTIETRSWSTAYRGWLAIHAAKGFPEWAKNLCVEKPFDFFLKRLGYTVETLPTGCVLAKANLIDCIRFTVGYEPPGHESEFGDFTIGRYGFIFAAIKRFEKPIPATGALNLWDWNIPDEQFRFHK